MNERMMRFSPGVAAEFVSAFEEIAEDTPKRAVKRIGLLGKQVGPRGTGGDLGCVVIWGVW
jgi:hypothetical protein